MAVKFDAILNKIREEDSGGGGTIDHGTLLGLTDDDHLQYALLVGRSGGQILKGGIDAGDDLTLQSSSNATKGSVFLGAAQATIYDEVNERLGINTTPTETFEVLDTAVFTNEIDNGDSGAADTIDFGAGNNQKSTLTANCTYTFTNPGGLGGFFLKITQGGVGSFTVTWPASVIWANGATAPSLSTTPGAVDLIGFRFDGTNYWGTFALEEAPIVAGSGVAGAVQFSDGAGGLSSDANFNWNGTTGLTSLKPITASVAGAGAGFKTMANFAATQAGSLAGGGDLNFYVNTVAGNPGSILRHTMTTGTGGALQILTTSDFTTTAPTAKVTIVDTGGVRFDTYGAGTLTTDASGNITAVSDERLKIIKGDYTRGLSDILKITPKIYNWNEESKLDQANEYSGFIAQNLQEAIPEAIGQGQDGMLTIQDRPVIAALVNAVKELNDIVTAQVEVDVDLQAQINLLK